MNYTASNIFLYYLSTKKDFLNKISPEFIVNSFPIIINNNNNALFLLILNI